MTSSPAIHLQQSHTLKLTPQLRQAIGLLQFNNRQLAAFLTVQAATNPYLVLRNALLSSGGDEGAASRRDLGPGAAGPGVAGGGAGGGAHDMDPPLASPDAGLFEHVRRQIDLAFRNPRQRAIAYVFAEALEPSGWLGRPVSAIAAAAGCGEDEAEAVLEVLHGFEPTGLFARSLAECLRLQARERELLTDVLATVLDHLELLGSGKIEQLARLCDTKPENILRQVEIIRRFDAKPGAAFDSSPSAIAPPDLIASQIDGDWQVELNRSTLPAVTVRGDLKPGAPELSGKDSAALLAEARWLEKAVARRNITTLEVGAELVRRQRAFMKHGPTRLVPMSVRDIAEAVEVHESTVRRITSGMMMETPRGSVLLRDFFSVSLRSGPDDEQVSAAAVREEIRKMIRAEDPAHPISDNAIAAHFKAKGVIVARRTVAKYREMLGLSGSMERRRRARLAGRGRGR